MAVNRSAASLTWTLSKLRYDKWYESPSFWPKEDELAKMQLQLYSNTAEYVQDNNYNECYLFKDFVRNTLFVHFNINEQLNYAEVCLEIILRSMSGVEERRDRKNINYKSLKVGKYTHENVFPFICKGTEVTIECNVILVPKNIPIVREIETTSKDNMSIKSRAEVISNEGLFSEFVTVKCEEQTLMVHAGILKARSSVLTAMLEADMKEKQLKEIVISDIRAKVMEQLVAYLYSDIVSTDNTEELFKAADKYDIRCLRSKLEVELAQDITSDNYLDLMNLAKLYDLKLLKKSTLLFIKDTLIDNL